MLIFPSTKHTTDFPNTGNLTHYISTATTDDTLFLSLIESTTANPPMDKSANTNNII